MNSKCQPTMPKASIWAFPFFNQVVISLGLMFGNLIYRTRDRMGWYNFANPIKKGTRYQLQLVLHEWKRTCIAIKISKNINFYSQTRKVEAISKYQQIYFYSFFFFFVIQSWSIFPINFVKSNITFGIWSYIEHTTSTHKIWRSNT